MTTIENELGLLRDKDVEKAIVWVDINGLVPLEMRMDIRLHTGEVTEVEFVYEELEKHCFI